ncbi:MAG: precorrin-6Y C5,15-methyltransferase (decarboxylating) subunit CbiT [Candidatus Bathyarchaeota archaeon]|nr:precorrin-6Y C5,15-methyltransferase (decarboxylating) subunit CbiT [Candidatus Bathyarchaeota archaeon]
MWNYKTPGVPDELFLQDEAVPGPTKEEIRVLTISKARLREGSVVIDVGCGTGGLTVESALQVAPKGKVYAIDKNAVAVALTRSNVERFSMQDIVEIVQGNAFDVLSGLPMADAVLVGGSHLLREVLCVCREKLQPGGRVVVNAILLETACTALDELKKLGFADVDATQVVVSKGRQVPSGTMMLSRNPITVISATKSKEKM